MSVSQCFISALYLEHILCKYTSNFVEVFVLGRSGLGLQMSKFCQITTELWSLINAQKYIFVQYFLNKWMDFDKTCLHAKLSLSLDKHCEEPS